jgi:hypothetical protein
LALPPLGKAEVGIADESQGGHILLSVRPPDPPAGPPAKAPAKPPQPDKKAAPTEIREVKDLEGCWVSEPGFKDAFGRPLRRSYCFDLNGNATYQATEFNSSGKGVDSCQNTATAKMSGKNFSLRVHTPPPTCSPKWVGGQYTCKSISPGLMRCTVQYRASNGRVTEHLDFHYSPK